MLQAACGEDDWTRVLGRTVSEYNATPHSSTGVAPLELLLGRGVAHCSVLPDLSEDSLQLKMKEQKGRDAKGQDTKDEGSGDAEGVGTEGRVEGWQSTLRKGRAGAVKRMISARTRSHAAANRKRVNGTLKVGDRVYWKDPLKGRNAVDKLRTVFQGPAVVKRLLPNGSVIIQVGKCRPRRLAYEQVKLMRGHP